jgi:hypothetical protein
MAYDAPKLRGYTFSKPPDKYEVTWDKITERHELSDGLIRQYVKGFKIKFKFTWDKNWLNPDDYSNIVAMYNDTSALALYPRPDTFTTLNHTVQITNDLNFVPWNNLLETNNQAYEGSIEGEGFYLTSICTNWT